MKSILGDTNKFVMDGLKRGKLYHTMRLQKIVREKISADDKTFT